jgi:hypothetical protein
MPPNFSNCNANFFKFYYQKCPHPHNNFPHKWNCQLCTPIDQGPDLQVTWHWLVWWKSMKNRSSPCPEENVVIQKLQTHKKTNHNSPLYPGTRLKKLWPFGLRRQPSSPDPSKSAVLSYLTVNRTRQPLFARLTIEPPSSSEHHAPSSTNTMSNITQNIIT